MKFFEKNKTLNFQKMREKRKILRNIYPEVSKSGPCEIWLLSNSKIGIVKGEIP